MIFFALTLSIAGKLYDRWGPKWVILFSTLLLSMGYGSISFIETLWEFHLYYGVLAAIGMGGASVPLFAALISKWFKNHRGLVISLALSGNCIGQFVLVPIFNDLVLKFGWRTSCLIIASCILLVSTSLALFVIKGEPGKFELHNSDHHKSFGKQLTIEPGGSFPGDRDLNLKEAMKTAPFWLYLVAMFVCGSGDFLVTAHLVPMVTDFNISPSIAAGMLAWFGLLSMGGILIAGPVSDRIGNKIPIILCFAIRLLLFILILSHQNLYTFYIFAAMFGFTFLITAPLTTTLIGTLYGFSHIGLITGFITMIHHMGGGFWAYIGGWSFDKTGSYQWSFIVSAVMAGIAMICTLMIVEKKMRLNTPP